MFVKEVLIPPFTGGWYLPVGGTWVFFIPIFMNTLSYTMKLQNMS